MTPGQYEKLISAALDVLRRALEYDNYQQEHDEWPSDSYLELADYITEVYHLLEERHANA